MGNDHPVPSMEEIERAYRRPLPGPSDSPWVRFAYQWQRKNWLAIKIIMVIWYVGVSLITAAAAIDVFGHLGWGYHPRDVVGGVLMMGLGIAMWAFFTLIQNMVSAWTRRVYGPDPAERRQDNGT